MDTIKLCIDIGNTSTKAAVYNGDSEIEYIELFTVDDYKRITAKPTELLVSKTGSYPELEVLLRPEHFRQRSYSYCGSGILYRSYLPLAYSRFRYLSYSRFISGWCISWRINSSRSTDEAKGYAYLHSRPAIGRI